MIRLFEVSSRTLPKAKTARFQMAASLRHSAATSPEVLARGIVGGLKLYAIFDAQNIILQMAPNLVITFGMVPAPTSATFARTPHDKNMGSKSQLSRLHDKDHSLILGFVASISKHAETVRGVATLYFDFDKSDRFVIRLFTARVVIRLFGRPCEKGHSLILSYLARISKHEGTLRGVATLSQRAYSRLFDHSVTHRQRYYFVTLAA